MQKPDERQAVPRLRRREFFKVGATSFMGFHLLPMLSPLSAFADISRDQLADYDWIVPGPSTPRYLAFERLFASAKKRPTARVLTASRGLIRSLIATSDRLTLLTRHEALLEEKLGVLRIAPTRLRLPRRTYGLATRANWRPTAEWRACVVPEW